MARPKKVKYDPAKHDAETVLQEHLGELTPESVGLGDTIEKVFKATGIDKIAKWVLGEDCKCEERKQKLNEMFPYKKPLCLTEEEYTWLTEYYATVINTVTKSQQIRLMEIYNRVFQAKRKITNCSDCVRTVHNELKKVYDTYEKDNNN